MTSRPVRSAAAPSSVVRSDQLDAALKRGGVLGAITFASEHGCERGDPRRLCVGLPPLGDGDGASDRAGADAELWWADGPVDSGWDGDIGFAADGERLFGHLLVTGEGDGGLEGLVRRTYTKVLQALRARGYPHLIRVWNVLQGINGAERGRERYQRFCSGRAAAFAAHGIGAGDLPAASAIGAAAPGLLIYFLAARRPGRQVENPRQVSAFSYPSCYGPDAPSFSRAMSYRSGGVEQVFLSGTASVVGHRSEHAGSVLDQLVETRTNLETLLAPTGDAAAARLQSLKVYLREPGEAAAVVAGLRAWAGDGVGLLVVAGDICRRELLVEVEGVALRPDAGDVPVTSN